MLTDSASYIQEDIQTKTPEQHPYRELQYDYDGNVKLIIFPAAYLASQPSYMYSSEIEIFYNDNDGHIEFILRQGPNSCTSYDIS